MIKYFFSEVSCTDCSKRARHMPKNLTYPNLTVDFYDWRHPRRCQVPHLASFSLSNMPFADKFHQFCQSFKFLICLLLFKKWLKKYFVNGNLVADYLLHEACPWRGIRTLWNKRTVCGLCYLKTTMKVTILWDL